MGGSWAGRKERKDSKEQEMMSKVVEKKEERGSTETAGK